MQKDNIYSAGFTYRIFLISAFAALSVSGTCPDILKKETPPGYNKLLERSGPDSSYAKLQHYIDSLLDTIAYFDDCEYQKSELNARNEMMHKRLNRLLDSVNNLNKFNLADICASLKNNKDETAQKEKLWKIFLNIQECEKEIRDSDSALLAIREEIKRLESTISRGQEIYASSKKVLNGMASGMNIPGKLVVKGARYRFYIAQLNEDRVRIHNNPNPNRGQSIRDVTDRLNKQKEDILMITNGGMYTPSYSAQGLLIENGRQYSPLDTLKPNNNLNFYLQPNGVFYTDTTGFYILSTDEYRTRSLSRKMLPLYATQSGPLLINNGVKNSKFKRGSPNHYIRSGVGILSTKKIVFVISDDAVNFYEFANVFDEIFGCKNALYLDGAISEMHINEKLSGFKNPKDNNGSFGPVISITRKK